MSQVVIGQLLQKPYLPQFTQPGGIGTPVVPQQEENNNQGMFQPGCGHSIMEYDVRCMEVDGEPEAPSAVVCCPLCGYVQTIITPFSEFLDMDFLLA